MHDGIRSKHLVKRAVTDEGDERDAPDEQRAEIAELRARLDHLGQAKLGSLRRMKRHEEGPEGAAKQDRDRHPDEVAAERHSDEADRDGREVRAASKPYRP